MWETRLSGSEGGGTELNRSFLPLRDYFFAAKSSPMRTVWQIWRIVSL